MPLPSIFFYDLRSMSFKFGKDIFITFEMPGVAYSRPVDKIHISLQFRPSVIRGPCPKLSYPHHAAAVESASEPRPEAYVVVFSRYEQG